MAGAVPVGCPDTAHQWNRAEPARPIRVSMPRALSQLSPVWLHLSEIVVEPAQGAVLRDIRPMLDLVQRGCVAWSPRGSARSSSPTVELKPSRRR